MLKRRFAPTSIPNFLNDPIEALTGTDRFSDKHRLSTAKEAADELRMNCGEKLPLAKHCEKIKNFRSEIASGRFFIKKSEFVDLFC